MAYQSMPPSVPSLPVTPPGSGVKFVVLESPTINLASQAVTAAYGPFPGYYFMPFTARWRNISTAGAISSTATTRAGNDGSNSNTVASSAFPATTDFGTGTPGYSTNLSPGRASPLNLSTAINIEVQTAATGTGGFAWTAKLYIFGALIPA